MEKEYLFNGGLYKIYESEEIHELLEDSEYFQAYIDQHSNSTEREIPNNEDVDPTNTSNKENVQQVTRDHQTTKLLLTEYQKLKEKFRDPKIKKKSLWREISKAFLIKGHIIEDAALDKKFRNLKSHYNTIKDNNKKTKTGQGRVSWEYFDIMDEIFEGDKTINTENVLSSMTSCTREQKENVETEHLLTVVDNNKVVDNFQCNDDYPSSSTPTSTKRRKLLETTNLHRFRNELLETEKNKTTALKVIAEQMIEYNRLLSRKLDLMEKYLNKNSD